MGRRGGGRGAGGGGLCGCALLAAALVASTLVIHGAGGLKQSHAPAVARKVLLSITNWHPQNYLDDVLHPSQVQEQRPERLGQDVPFQTGNELPNPHLHQVPAALPSLPVQPYAPHPKISADTPTAAPSFQKMPWYPQPSPTPTSQETSKVSIASPPAEFLNQRKPPLGVSVTSPPLPAIGRRMQSPAASPETSVHPAKHGKDHGAPVTAPSNVSHHHSMPANNTHGETHGPPVVAPIKRRHHHLPANNSYVKGPAVSPSKSPIIHRKGHGIAAPPKENSSYLPPANHRHHKGSPHPALRKSNNTSAPSHGYPGSPAPAPVRLPPSKGKGQGNSAHAPRHPNQYHLPSYSPGSALPPAHSPETPAFRKPKALAPAPSQSLLPPPTNSYCTCSDPLTNSPPGMTCLCVLPIKVELRFGIALYTFFTLVPELAQDIASGVFMNQSQVRVMGANAAPDDPEKTVVFIDLVPLGPKFDNATAFLVFERFCNKQVIINPVHFGKYDVLYVLYQGLPPSPPAASMNNGLSNVNDPSLHPLAADVGNHRERKGRGIIIIIILSSVFAFILCAGAALVVYFKLRNRSHLTEASLVPTKPAGPGSAMVGSRLESRPISVSPSFSSSLVAYKGSAKTFNLVEMERATLGFDESRIIGEGGFGRVYEGILEDGERVAIKVLKRDDQQGTREFLAEVEMLSRLHHRNLVKLIGICTEGHSRCLVYELVPNGSVESHLHDKGAARFDWDARLKIALGAARALAYLHEDSSPRVIHRDFKSSNILLEHDFTPKVSDFGLARTALGEGNEHISTRVMGTFGYVAPEYAMTGHLLVKSDVYSYGVVLLELLTGRKPVDMLRPAGQENLVAWAGSLLTSRDGLESIIDPSLGSSIPFDSIAKVAAIASMCVQPEVDQRPFMGEVVQALKLVCNEGSEFNETTSFSQDLHIQDVEAMSRASMDIDVDPTLSAELFTSSARYDAMDASGSFRRYSSSGPLRIGRAGLNKERGLSTGSSSEHVGLQKFRIDSE
ncbi:receptor-like serine/threonine-protein kinase ALE2 isoform X2 [Sorghum bicolor]|uniref:receptor-like serine/threonine-protein kinase ALE2 isoform X2 n=1 Tax=Sorghum bicolor TaxID=4558 RepID=UPI000B424014|nr:receptor-like serine/threonine-protein kinase ALE2 isoform X2 [Sorghum bicolor]|eukprot:XP_021313526.1 receptor-like serine/threonine-protein kinase ALE2 isoform X2 [Sorghum bicolor]